MTRTAPGLVAATLLLGACGGESTEEQRADATFDELTGTLDKAADVEQQVLEQKDRLDRAVDDAEGSGREDPPGR